MYLREASAVATGNHIVSVNRPTTKWVLLRMREAVKSRSRCTYSWKMSNGEPLLAFATSSKLVVAIVDTICMHNRLHVILLII